MNLNLNKKEQKQAKRLAKKLIKQEKKRRSTEYRYLKEQRFKKKHPFISSIWKDFFQPFMVVVVVLAIGVSGYMIYTVYQQYQESLYWKDHHEVKVDMALQPPSLLYDNDPTSKQAKTNFTSIYYRVYDETTKDFKENTNQKDIDQLNIELGKMTDDEYKQEYQSRYDLLQAKWTIETKYRALYTDNKYTTLTTSVTPERIINLNAETYDQLVSFAKDSEGKDEFAKRIYNWQTNLLDDAIVLNDQAITLNQWLTKDKDELVVQADLYPNEFNQYLSTISHEALHYKWSSLKGFNKLLADIQNITKAHMNRHNDYLAIENDKQQHEDALNAVKQRIVDSQNTLSSVQDNIQKEKNSLNQQKEDLIKQREALNKSLQDAQDQQADKLSTISSSKKAESESKEKAESASSASSAAAESSRQQEQSRLESESRAQSSASSASRENSSSARRSASSSSKQSSSQRPSSASSSPSSSVVEESFTSSEIARLDQLIGQDALQAFNNLDDIDYTYARETGVSSDLSNGMIKSYSIQGDKQVRFTVGTKP